MVRTRIPVDHGLLRSMWSSQSIHGTGSPRTTEGGGLQAAFRVSFIVAEFLLVGPVLREQRNLNRSGFIGELVA